MDSSDRDMYQAAIRGDRDAFEMIIRSSSRTLFAIAYGVLQNRAEAEDVVQDAFVKAWKSRWRVRDPEKFPGWLATIARAGRGEPLGPTALSMRRMVQTCAACSRRAAAPRGACRLRSDVDGREDAPLGQPAVEVQLHVAGALELLVDHVVHAAAGVDQAGGDDRQAAALLDVARGAEEALGRVERDRVDTAGERAAAAAAWRGCRRAPGA